MTALVSWALVSPLVLGIKKPPRGLLPLEVILDFSFMLSF